MSDQLTIYGYDDNPRTRIVKIVAAAEGIKLYQSLVVPRKGINKITYMELFPLSQGKIPAIAGPGVMITETIAIAYYLAKINPKAHLLGLTGSLDEEALVLSYVSFANQELLPTLARWFLPLIPGLTYPAPYDFDAVEKGKQASILLLDKLELVMEGKEWLVGNRPTLADIFIGIMVSRGLQWVLGRAWRETHPAIMAHFERFSRLQMVSGVIPKFHLAEAEPLNQKPPVLS